MAGTSGPTARNTIFSIDTSEHDLAIIDRAAAAVGKSRPDFMAESARHAAEDVLLSRTFFVENDAAYEQVVALLDNPTPSTGALRKLLNTHAPWE